MQALRSSNTFWYFAILVALLYLGIVYTFNKDEPQRRLEPRSAEFETLQVKTLQVDFLRVEGMQMEPLKLEPLKVDLGTIRVQVDGTAAVDTDKLASFYAIAKEAGTDKVTTHSYQNMYDKYLPELRRKKIKMLEIGLGCDMNYGPGKSLKVWQKYFETYGAELHFIEVDAVCAAKWQSSYPNIKFWAGSQKDVAFLDTVKAGTGGANQFDLIIDDGGHTMSQQKISMINLWSSVKPGGYYVIEDLQTSFLSGYIDEYPTAIQWIKEFIDCFYVNAGDRPATNCTLPFVTKEVLSYECFYEACVFHKKPVA